MERKLRGVYHRVNRSVGMRLAEHAFVFVVQLRRAVVGTTAVSGLLNSAVLIRHSPEHCRGQAGEGLYLAFCALEAEDIIR